MGRAIRRGSVPKALVGSLVLGVLFVVGLWGLLSTEPGMEPIDRVQQLIQINDTLDHFHASASRADGDAYFAHFAPEGVFLGTDATERWTVDEFRAYAAVPFSEGRGWTYVPKANGRHIELIRGSTIAVFDELLVNEKYGECRGTGVLRNRGDHWLIVQYNLHFPVPNDLAEHVTTMIQDGVDTGTSAQKETAPE